MAKTKFRYHVYVVELSRKIWTDSAKFRAANPTYKGISQCLYVGMTSNTPEERYKKHKTGYRTKKGIKISSRFVEKYGLYLRPSLYERYNPLTKEEAIRVERQLAEKLRKNGYAVWWN